MSAGAASIVDFPEALHIVLRDAASVRVPDAQRIMLLASLDRVLAEPIAADRDHPPFDRATRDGFAVRAQEWSAGTKLRVVGQVRAGEMWTEGGIGNGESVEIMTGAPVPAGMDAVVMVEHAEQSGDEAWAVRGRSLRAGENVVPRGSEARAGGIVLETGTSLGAAEIALAAACGYGEVHVYQRPRVAILATGDELVEVGEMPLPYQIRNSNSYALGALVSAAGGEPRRLPIVRDACKDLRALINQARGGDLLLLSGGISAGKYDLVQEVLAEFGAEFFFRGVRMQPGKPVVFGRLPKTAARQISESASQQELIGRDNSSDKSCLYFFGLPGNPISTEVTFHCLVYPMLRALCGASPDSIAPRFAQATLSEDIRPRPGLTRLLPARLTHDLDKPAVRLVAWQGSGDLAANARANCYAVLPDGRDIHAGDVVTVLLR